MPQLWVLAGGNGAGKSTFFKQSLQSKEIPFVNADEIAKQLHPQNPDAHARDAALRAGEQRLRYLDEGRTFCMETVFSHSSKVDFIAKAKTKGFEIILVFIHLERVDLNEGRVDQRVAEGGHGVDRKKIGPRIKRLLKYVAQAVPLCDQVYVVDNSSTDDPLRPVATIRNGTPEELVDPLPEWASDFLQRALSE